jgi:general secretion pathway protein G
MRRCHPVGRAVIKSSTRGYTLLEIMVVLVIIGLVSSITTVAVMKVLKDARRQTTDAALSECQSALKLYALKHGHYPTTAQGIAALVSEKSLPKMPIDGWRNELHYTYEDGKYSVISYGDDGAPGGVDDGADIVVTSE